MTQEFKFTGRNITKVLADILMAVDMLDENAEHTITITDEKPIKKRSNKSNAMLWEFINKLSKETGVDRIEIYRRLVRDVGENANIAWVKNEAVEDLRRKWSVKGTGWIADKIDERKGWQLIQLVAGSSTYNIKQMMRLIDSLLQECEAVGIDTTPLIDIDYSDTAKNEEQ